MHNLDEQIAEWEQRSYIDLSSFAELLQFRSGEGRLQTGKHKQICQSLEKVWDERGFDKQGIFVVPEVFPAYKDDEKIPCVEILVPSLPLSRALGISERTLQQWRRGTYKGISVEGDGKGNYGFVSSLATAIRTSKPIHSALKRYAPDGLWRINHQYSWQAIA
jgi:hypothetical protein